MTHLSFRDIELLTAYLDGQLDANKKRLLETRLGSDPNLRTTLDELSATRNLLRRTPHRRAPRNFTLTPKMAGIRPPLPRAYPVFRFASVLATLLLFLTLTLNFTAPLISASSQMAAAPYAFGRGGGANDSAAQAPAAEAPAVEAPAEAAATEAPAATEALPEFAPLAPQATELPAGTVSPSTDIQPTATEEFMAQAEPFSKVGPEPSTSEVQNQPAALIIPQSWMVGLFVLASLAGGVALIIRFGSERKWRKSNIKNSALPTRDIILLAIAIVLVIAAIWGITALAKGNLPFTSSVNSVAVFVPTNIPPAPGQKGNLDPSGNKGGSFTAENGRFSLAPGMGYNFTYSDPQGYVIALAFPDSAFDGNTDVQFSVGLGAPAPDGFTYAGRGFQFYAVPANLPLMNSVNVTIFYSDADVAHVMNEDTLVLLYWDGSNWLDAASTCSPSSYISRSNGGNVISLDVCQSGSFALFAPQ
jgi:anti-sigma factor RsiW